jgi:hypothetical protein
VLVFEQVAIGRGHGIRCTRCHPVGEVPVYHPAAEVLTGVQAVVAAWRGGPGPNVTLTGPEPFAHPELPAIVAGGIEAGVSRLRLEVGGGAFTIPGNADGALGAGVRHVQVTLLGGTEGVHDALAGGPGAFDAATAGMAAWADAVRTAGVDAVATVLVRVCRHNVGDLPAAVGAAVRAGAASVLLRVEDGGIDLPAAVPWITAACDTGVVNGVWVEVEGVPFCMLPGYELHLASTVRPAPGAKPAAVCSACALDPVCSGGPRDASAETMSAFSPPEGAERLAEAVSRSRGGAA